MRIEAKESDVRKIKHQLFSVETMLQSSYTHAQMLQSSWDFLSGRARIVSLNEAKSIRKSIVSITNDMNVLHLKLNGLNLEIAKIEEEIELMKQEKERVKLKIFEIKT
jgi:chromosome segregation ATPase